MRSASKALALVLTLTSAGSLSACARVDVNAPQIRGMGYVRLDEVVSGLVEDFKFVFGLRVKQNVAKFRRLGENRLPRFRFAKWRKLLTTCEWIRSLG